MYESRHIELEKLINIMNKLNKELESLKRDIHNEESKSNKLVLDIEEDIKLNIKSIKELENPFLLFIMGSGNYGKSTLINVLLEDKIIETSDIPNTWKVDLFINSDNEKIKIHYKNKSEVTKSLSSGKQLIKEEEDKFKLSKAKITKNVLDYKNKLNKDKLKKFKIDQEKMYLYKSEIEEIKYYLKNKKILNDFIIVDTPGLNQTLLKNTQERMYEYYEKTDGIIWLIDAQNIVSKETNKLIEGINKIDTLHEKRIICVVNKIDLIKNNKDLEKLKEKVNQIYKNKFNNIVYISAYEALQGVIKKDKYLIDKSNINELYNSIDIYFKQVCEKNQINSKYKNLLILKEKILNEIYKYKRCLYKDISSYNEITFDIDNELKKIYLYVVNYINTFKNKQIYNQNYLNLLKSNLEELEVQCSKDIQKSYEVLLNKSNFNNSYKNTINTNVCFSKSKYLLITYNDFTIPIKNNKKSNFINQIIYSSYKTQLSNEEKLNNHIYKNITNLEKEIIETLKDKLEYIKYHINKTKENTFKEKYLEYESIKKHLTYLDNIEKILINLR